MLVVCYVLCDVGSLVLFVVRNVSLRAAHCALLLAWCVLCGL